MKIKLPVTVHRPVVLPQRIFQLYATPFSVGEVSVALVFENPRFGALTALDYDAVTQLQIIFWETVGNETAYYILHNLHPTREAP